MSEFLAEARVLIRPDTTGFRATLEAELLTATRKPLVVPVAAAIAPVGGGSTRALTRELEEQRIVQERLGSSTEKAAATTAAQARAQTAAAAASRSLALAQAQVVDAASAVSAAQITATRSTAAVAAANKAVAVALTSQDAILIKTTRDTLALAEAQSLEASAALRAARAQATHAATLGQVQKAGLAGAAGMLGLRGATLTAGVGFIGATVALQSFVKSVQLAAGLETELNVFATATKATSLEMELAAENARKLGRDLSLPGVTAIDAAQAQLQLARAGFEVQQALDGTRGTLQLATAAQIDFGKSAELVAGAVNAFGLSGADATRVADLLTGAANESQGSIEDMGIALRQSAGAAALLGLSVEDTVVLLTQLVKAGLAGSDAGTTLRVALVRLARPDTRAEVEKLVGSLEDLQGNLDPTKIVKLADEIQKTGGKLDQTNRLYELFGENALRVVGLLGQQGVEGFNATSGAITESGLAAENAAARMKGLEGDIETLSNEATAAGLTLGTLASPIISSLAGGATLAFRGINILTGGIESLIDPPREAAKSIGEMQARLQEAQRDLERFKDSGGDPTIAKALQVQVNEAAKAFERLGISAKEAIGGISAFDIVARGVTGTLAGLIGTLNKLKATAVQGGTADSGLNVQQLLNRVTGFDSAETRARIRGNTTEILSVLQEEQAFLESQLQRDFVKRRPSLQRQLENALLGTVNDIASIQKTGAAAMKTAVDDAARAQRDADQALLDLLSNRRDDVQRKIAAASETEGVGDDIRSQNRLQAIIKQQITKIRERVTDEKERKAAIRELRIALIASRQEEDALRAQQRQDAAARKAEGINLDIDFAEITGNVAREIAARQRLIALLRKQQAGVKKGTAEWKRLRNEIATQQQAIKDAKKQADDNQDDGKSAQAFFFEQLQAQQGFASNLLGNLITGPTAGLVGTPSPTTPGRGIAVAAAVQEGKRDGGPTSGQASTTNDILLRILQQLRTLNGSYDAPEAINQKKSGGASMDYAVM